MCCQDAATGENMLIKVLHAGKHESWEAVSLKGGKRNQFWGVGFSEDKQLLRVICHVEENSPVILHSCCCLRTLADCDQCRSLQLLTLLPIWWKQKPGVIFFSSDTDDLFCHWFICRWSFWLKEHFTVAFLWRPHKAGTGWVLQQTNWCSCAVYKLENCGDFS